MRMHHSSDKLNYCRDRALKFLGAIVIVLIIGFIMSDRKDKTSKQAWINQNVAAFPIRIDSTITIRNCVFDKNGLIISASVPSAAGSDIDDEELAVLCFHHLNQYDLGNVRECFRLISRNNGSLIITIDDAENNEFSRLVYQQETVFERLWEICLRINPRRDEIQKEAESNDQKAKANRVREQLKKSLSMPLAY